MFAIHGHTKRARSIRLIAIVILALCVGQSRANAQLGGLTLGVALDRLMGQVNEAIDRASSAGNALEVEAGRQAFLVIGQAKVAYKEVLDKTISSLTPEVKKTFDQLTTTTNEIEGNLGRDAQLALSHLQTIAQTLPFHDHQPKLGGVTPSFVVPSTHISYVTFRFRGSFEFAGRSAMSPSLRIGKDTYRPSKATTQDVEFLVPSSAIAKVAKESNVSFVRTELIVPWIVERWIRSDKRYTETFPALVGILPLVPGPIHIMEEWEQPTSVTKHVTSPNHHVSSQRDGNNSDKDERFSDTGHAECSIIRDTVSKKGSGHGDHSDQIVSIDEHTVITRATTSYHRFGESGVVDFWIEFDEACPSREHKSKMTIVNDGKGKADLTWGDSRSYAVQPGASYKVIIDQFDGHHHEYSRPSPLSGMVVVKSAGNAVELSTADPQTFVWP